MVNTHSGDDNHSQHHPIPPSYKRFFVTFPHNHQAHAPKAHFVLWSISLTSFLTIISLLVSKLAHILRIPSAEMVMAIIGLMALGWQGVGT